MSDIVNDRDQIRLRELARLAEQIGQQSSFVLADGGASTLDMLGQRLTYIPGDSSSDPVFGASGPNHAAGDVPDPGSTAGTSRFLREDAAWAAPVLTLATQTVAVSVPFSGISAGAVTTVSWSGVFTSGSLLQVSGSTLQFKTGSSFLLSAYAESTTMQAGTFGLWLQVASGAVFGHVFSITTTTGLTSQNLGWAVFPVVTGAIAPDPVTLQYFMTGAAATSFSVQAIQIG